MEFPVNSRWQGSFIVSEMNSDGTPGMIYAREVAVSRGDPGKYVTTRTAQAIFEQAGEAVELSKGVSVHSLRHSFTTHLLESGVDLRYIRELPGHKSSKTTEIYPHVSNKDTGKIKSPLDNLQIKGGGEDDRGRRSLTRRMNMRTLFGYTTLSEIAAEAHDE